MKTELITNRENKSQELTLTINIPFQESKASSLVHVSAKLILGDIVIRSYLKKALEARMNACAQNLAKHQDKIIFCNEMQIAYQKENRIKYFNAPSFQLMKDMVKYLNFFNRDESLDKAPLGGWAQIAKALYWVEKQDFKITTRNSENELVSIQIDFSDLVSMLEELNVTQILNR